LLDRPRHGRIRLQGRWIHFPLRPLDLALRLPPVFAAGAASDMVLRPFRRRNGAQPEETFASVLEAGLGRTICREFYFPYARKLWGVSPEHLSPAQAHRRVSAGSPAKMIRKVLSAVPGLKPQGSGRFFYPRGGFGQINQAYYLAACAAGADIRLSAPVHRVDVTDRMQVEYGRDGERGWLQADYVWSTIPITRLAQSLVPDAPSEVLEAAARMQSRGMILIYLVLGQGQFSEYDAHYFPGQDIPISRLSEPKNYSGRRDPQDVTVLCAEMPCDPAGAEWAQTDEALGQLVCRALDQAGIPVRAPVRQVVTRRLRQAYPIYHRGYEADFDQIDDWLGRFPRLLTFGRQGLFAHDNTHHALHMAYAAAGCLNERGEFDPEAWQAQRRVFETHVVED